MIKIILVLVFIYTFGLSNDIPKTIKIVYNSGTPPLKFTDNENKANGMLIDIWKLWAVKTKQNIEFIEASWDDTLLMVKNGQADIHGGLYYTKERADYLDYTSKPLYQNKNYFYYHKDIKGIKTNKDILPFVVGIGNGFPRKFMKENHSDIVVKNYDSSDKMIHAVENQEIKVILGSLAGFTYLLKKYNLKVDEFKHIEASPVFIKEYFGAVKNGNDNLLKLLNDGFNKISKNELKNIENKWTKDLDMNQFSAKKNLFQFTQKEQNFISKTNTIKIVSNPAWPPFSFLNKKTNKPDGIAADYIKLIAKETGLKFEYTKASSWDESIKKIQNKEIDIFGVIKQTPKRDKYLNFTDTYITFPMVAVTKSDISFVSSIDDIKTKKFAMIKNFSSTEYLNTNYPDLNIILVNSAKECMDLVANGTADIFIGSLGTVSYILKEYGYVNLKIAGKIGVTSSWGVGVRNNMEPELISIFNKALKSISQKDKDKILNKWITIEFDEQVDYTIIYQIIGLFIFFLLGTIYWSRKLKNAQKEIVASEVKTRSIIENSQDALIVINKESTVVMWNASATTIFGFKFDEIIGKSIEIIIPDGFKKLHFAGINRVIDGGERKLLGKGAIEIEGVHKNGTIIPIDLALNTYTIDYEIFFSANIRDISERKALSMELAKDKQLIEDMHKHTKESIEYSAIIQSALIPEANSFRDAFTDYFAYWRPKDTVGGDIYLFEELRGKKEEYLLMVIDCTGHGIPGAFVTMMVKSIEQQILQKIESDPTIEISPAWIMGYFNRKMKHLLKQENNNSISNVGWDGGIIYYNKRDQILKFAGAETPLFYMTKDGEFKTVKGNRYSVGYKKCAMDYEYKETIIEVEEGMKFYCTTDGYLDQNGGEKDFPFGKKRFGNIIKENYQETMPDQLEIFLNKMNDYEKMIENNDRNDDITMVGFTI